MATGTLDEDELESGLEDFLKNKEKQMGISKLPIRIIPLPFKKAPNQIIIRWNKGAVKDKTFIVSVVDKIEKPLNPKKKGG